MSWGFVCLCAAASAATVYSTSALSSALLAGFRHQLDRLSAAAQARVVFGVVLLPLVLGAAVMTAALAPYLGWIIDHCTVTHEVHAHPHLCHAHVMQLPTWTLIALGLVLLLRLVVRAARVSWSGVTMFTTERSLVRLCRGAERDGTRVLPFEYPQAFVVGALRPRLFVTRGLLSEEHREHLQPVLLHERAHLRRHDPLRRLVASLALAFHLPGVAGWLERTLGRAHEMAADAEAARELGNPERVAQALVTLTRAQRHVPLAALAFGGSDVEARVATLLDRRPRFDHPGTLALVAGALLLVALVARSAGAVHHGVEIVLGLLGG